MAFTAQQPPPPAASSSGAPPEPPAVSVDTGSGSWLVVALRAAGRWLVSPQARRYEVALVVGVYEAVRAALGHA